MTTRKQRDAIPAKHLPEGSTENNRFRAVFVTTYICWVAQYPDPWRIDNEEAVSVMQKIWAEVYGKKIQYRITADTPAFKQVRHLLSMEIYSRCYSLFHFFRPSSGCVTVGVLLSAPQRCPL